jgi:hypothetical protein
METNLLLAHAFDRFRRQEMKEAGFQSVEISGSGNEDDYPVCGSGRRKNIQLIAHQFYRIKAARANAAANA